MASSSATRRRISGAKFGRPVKRSVAFSAQRVADAQRAVVGNADDVAGERLVGESRARCAKNRIGECTAIDLPVAHVSASCRAGTCPSTAA